MKRTRNPLIALLIALSILLDCQSGAAATEDVSDKQAILLEEQNALSLIKSNKAADGRAIYERILPDLARSLGVESLAYGVALSNCSITCMKLQDWDAMCSYAQQASGIFVKSPTPEANKSNIEMLRTIFWSLLRHNHTVEAGTLVASARSANDKAKHDPGLLDCALLICQFEFELSSGESKAAMETLARALPLARNLPVFDQELRQAVAALVTYGHDNEAEKLVNDELETLKVNQSLSGEERRRKTFALYWTFLVSAIDVSRYDACERLAPAFVQFAKSQYGSESNEYAEAVSRAGLVNQMKGNFKEATLQFTLAVEIFKKLGKTKRLANSLLLLGAAYKGDRRTDAAKEAFEQALKVSDSAETKITLLDQVIQELESSGDRLGTIDARFRKLDLLKSTKADPPAIADCLMEQGYALMNFGKNKESVAAFTECLTIRRTLPTAEAETTINVMVQLGIVNGRLKNDQESERFAREALAECEKLPLDRQDIVRATCLNAQGLLHSEAGNYSKSEEYYREAIKLLLRRRNEKDFPTSFATQYINLGSVLLKAGRFEESEPYLRRGTDLRVKAVGPDHYSSCSGRLELAKCLLKRELLEEAEEQARQVYNAVTTHKNSSNAQLEQKAAITLCDILLARGKSIDALPLLRKRLAMSNPTADNAAYIGLSIILARALVAVGSESEAATTIASAENLLKSTAGDSWERQGLLYAKAQLMLARCNNDEALKLLLESLEIARRLSGKDQSTVAMLLMRVAQYYEGLGRLAESERYLNEAINVPDVKNSATAVNCLLLRARLLVDSAKTREANDVLLEALKTAQQSKLVASFPTIYRDLGEANLDLGNLFEAERYFKQALDCGYSDLSADLRTRIVCGLAKTYLVQGKIDEANRLGSTALAELSKTSATSWVAVQIYFLNCQIATRQKQLSEARNFQAKAIEIAEKLASTNKISAAYFYRKLGLMHRTNSHYREAETAYETALKYFQAVDGSASARVTACLEDIRYVKEKQAHPAKIDRADEAPRTSATSGISPKTEATAQTSATNSMTSNVQLEPEHNPTNIGRYFLKKHAELTREHQEKEILELCTETLAKLDATPGPSTEKAAVLTYGALAAHSLHDETTAQSLISRAEEYLSKDKNSRPVQLKAIYRNLALFYESAGDNTKCLRYLELLTRSYRDSGFFDDCMYGSLLTWQAKVLKASGKNDEFTRVAFEAGERLRYLSGRYSQIQLFSPESDNYKSWAKYARASAGLTEASSANDAYGFAKLKIRTANAQLELAELCAQTLPELSRGMLEHSWALLKELLPFDYGTRSSEIVKHVVGDADAIAGVYIALWDFGKGCEVMEQAKPFIPLENAADRAKFAAGLAMLFSKTGNLVRAQEYAQDALNLLADHKSAIKPEHAMSILETAADIAVSREKFDDAIALERQVQAIEPPSASTRSRFMTICNLGYILTRANQIAEATSCMNDCESLISKNGQGLRDSTGFHRFRAAWLLAKHDYKGAALELPVSLESENDALVGSRLILDNRFALANAKALDGKTPVEEALNAARQFEAFRGPAMQSLTIAEQAEFFALNADKCVDMLCWSSSDRSQLEKSYPYLLRWKGVLVDGMHHETMARKSIYANAAARELESLREQLTKNSNEPGEQSKKRTDELVVKIAEAERSLRQAVVKTPRKDVLGNAPLQQVTNVLRPNEILIDLYKFREPRQLSGDRKSKYLAILVSSSAPPTSVDLGSASEIDQAIESWITDMSLPSALQRNVSPYLAPTPASPVQYSDIANQFSKVLWTKLANEIPDGVDNILISPDSELAKVPWDSLVNQNSKRTFKVTIVDCPRVLVSLRGSPTLPESTKSLAIAGAISFKNAPTLPETGIEIDEIAQFARQQQIACTTLKGDTPTKDRLLEACSGASYIHLATHGFFATKDPTLDNTAFRSVGIIRNSRGDSELVPTDSVSRNPLSLSGLYVAPSKNNPAGILKAEELVGIDFSKCDLFTLSACQTGLGETYTGQGIIGLRSALEAAGCKSVLMSLWKVDDAATRALMSEFYKNLWKNPRDKILALQAAQESIRRRPEWQTPYYWAAWVLAGEGW